VVTVRCATYGCRRSKGGLVAVGFGQLGGGLPVAEGVAGGVDELEEVLARRRSESGRIAATCGMAASGKAAGHGEGRERTVETHSTNEVRCVLQVCELISPLRLCGRAVRVEAGACKLERVAEGLWKYFISRLFSGGVLGRRT
jgi:hypothetical protein